MSKNENAVPELVANTIDARRVAWGDAVPDHADLTVIFEPGRWGSRRLTFGISERACSLGGEPEHLMLKECLRRWRIARG